MLSIGIINQKKICEDISKIISEYLNVKGKVYDLIYPYLEYKNRYKKIYEKEYGRKFNDCRDEDVEEKEEFINQKLSQLRIHQLIKQIKLDELPWDFDAVSLYPSAMWDENSV